MNTLWCFKIGLFAVLGKAKYHYRPLCASRKMTLTFDLDTDGHFDRRTDATKHIISPALWSIKMLRARTGHLVMWNHFLLICAWVRQNLFCPSKVKDNTKRYCHKQSWAMQKFNKHIIDLHTWLLWLLNFSSL